MPRKATVLKTAAFTSSATSALKGVEVMGFEPTARDFRTALSHTAKVSYCNGKNAMLTHGGYLGFGVGCRTHRWWPQYMMKLNDLILRCFAERDNDGTWFVMCIDLNLYARDDSFEAARKKLHIFIKDYLNDAVKDPYHFDDLVPRKAPFYFFVRYYLIFIGIAPHAILAPQRFSYRARWDSGPHAPPGDAKFLCRRWRRHSAPPPRSQTKQAGSGWRYLRLVGLRHPICRQTDRQDRQNQNRP